MRRKRGPRWTLWLTLLAVLVALRIAIPVVVGPLLEERLSRMLGAAVDVGDVSFAPIDAIVTLGNVTVHAPGAPVGGDDAAPAMIAARVRLDLQWLPLLHRTLLVREVSIESGRIDLARFAGAGASVTSLLQVEPATELPPGWSFALDRIVLRDTQVRLHGLDADDPVPLDVGVRDAQVSTLRKRATAFGRAPNLRIDALVEGGRVRIDGTSDLRDDGVLIDTLVRVKDVALARLQPYLSSMGWTAVGGRVSGQLRYQRDPGRRDLVTGRLRARRIALHVPAHDGPALAVRRVEAELDAFDLRQRRVALGSLTLHGARLAIRPDLAAPLPLLDGVAFAHPGPGRERRPQPAGDTPRLAPWTWSIGHLATPFARLHVAGHGGEDGGEGGEVVLSAGLSGESLGPAAYWSPVRAWVGRGRGVAVFDGTARATRGLVIDGRLTARDVDVPTFARAVGMPLAELAQVGHASADLTVEIEPGATRQPPLDVRGRITLADLWLAGPVAGELAFGAAAVDLTLAGIDVARGDVGAAPPVRVRFDDAAVGAPYALLTRTADGWILPPFEAAPAALEDGAAASADVTAGAGPASTPEVAGDSLAAQQSPPRTEVVLATVRTSGGRVLVVDRTMEPAGTFDVALVEGWLQDLRLPAATLGAFVAQGSDPRFGVLQVAGSRSADRREIDLSAQAVPLVAAAPYLEQAGLPYRFTRGTAALVSQLVLAGDRWSADTTLTLRDARMTGDDVQLRQALGMAPEAALAALRDIDGDVTVRLSMSSSSAPESPPLADLVAGALRAAIARTRQMPLPAAPIEIAFAPGRAELSVQGARQLESIVEILVARPDAVVELSGAPSSADRRWLAEQELVVDLDEPSGLMSVLRVLGIRDQRERIRNALEERGAGRPGRLDSDDEAVVTELIAEGPPISADRLAALAAARLAGVANRLADRAVARARVRTVDPPARETAAAPAVRARIGVDTRPPFRAGGVAERR